MRRIAAVVIEKAFFEIVRGSDVLFARVRFGSEEVGIVHFYLAVPGGSLEGDAYYLAGLPGVSWVVGGVRLRQGFGGRSSLRLALRFKRRLERVTRLELATSSLARRCSTTELHPHFAGQPSPQSAGWKGMI